MPVCLKWRVFAVWCTFKRVLVCYAMFFLSLAEQRCRCDTGGSVSSRCLSCIARASRLASAEHCGCLFLEDCKPYASQTLSCTHCARLASHQCNGSDDVNLIRYICLMLLTGCDQGLFTVKWCYLRHGCARCIALIIFHDALERL